MNPYKKYKPTNIAWIGEIPEHWEEIKLKYIGYLYAGLSGKSGEDFKKEDSPLNKPFIPFTNICNNEKINPEHLEQVVINDGENQNQVAKGDLFFMMSSEDFDAVGKSTVLLENLDEVYLNSFCKGFRITDKNTNSLFLNYLLLCHPFRRRMMIEANGFTRINLKMEKVNDFLITLPPLSEQTAIANFLDEKTSQIDTLIGKKQKQIELLIEERSAIINEALNGEGKNWERKKLKYIAEIKSSNVDKKTKDGEISVKLCNYTDVYKNDFIDNSFDFMMATATQEEILKFVLKKGDVVVTKDSETPDDIANPALIIEDLQNIICGYHLAMIRANEKKLLGEFLFRLFQSKKFNARFEVEAHGITRYGLGIDAFSDAFVPLPPIKEQQKIVQHIQTETQRIDKTILTIEKEIELLQEYRRALISEAVTGKIDVREKVQSKVTA